MELDVFAGQEKSELSMIEVARAILETRGRDNEMYFNDLVNEIQNYLEKSDADIRNALPFFYSDLNTDGSGEDAVKIPFGGCRNPFTVESSIEKECENGNYRWMEVLFH